MVFFVDFMVNSIVVVFSFLDFALKEWNWSSVRKMSTFGTFIENLFSKILITLMKKVANALLLGHFFCCFTFVVCSFLWVLKN